MAGLDQFYSDLATTDTKKKITIGTNIINYLEDDTNSIECEDIGGFIDGLVPWMQSSNFKVAWNIIRSFFSPEVFDVVLVLGKL